MIDDDAVADGDGVDVGADRARELLGADALGARLAQLGQGRDLEHPVGDLGLEAGEQAPGQRVALDGGERA